MSNTTTITDLAHHQDHLNTPESLVMSHLVATADALDACMDAHGTPAALQDGVIALRHAADFALQAALELASADSLEAPEVVTQYKLAVWKLIEFAMLMPPKARRVPARWFKVLAEPAATHAKGR